MKNLKMAKTLVPGFIDGHAPTLEAFWGTGHQLQILLALPQMENGVKLHSRNLS